MNSEEEKKTTSNYNSNFSIVVIVKISTTIKQMYTRRLDQTLKRQDMTQTTRRIQLSAPLNIFFGIEQIDWHL